MVNNQDQFSEEGTKQGAQQTDYARQLTTELKEQLNIRSKLSENEKGLLSLAQKIQQASQVNRVEIGRAGDAQKQLTKDKELALKAELELAIQKKGANAGDIAAAAAIAANNERRLRLESMLLNTQAGMAGLSGQELVDQQKKYDRIAGALSLSEKNLNTKIKEASEDAQQLAIAQQAYNLQQQNVKLSQEEEAIQKKITEAMGLTGSALGVANKLLGKFADAFKLGDAQKAMQDFADEAVRSGKEVSRLQTLGVGLKAAFSGLTQTLSDPVVIFGAIIKQVNALQTAQKAYRQEVGQSVDNIEILNGSLTSTVDYVKAAGTLAKELSVNASVVFSQETITEVAELTELMGMGGKEAANLAKFSKISGQELSTVTSNAEKSFQTFVKTNATGIKFGDVLKDVGSVSNSLAMQLGNNPGRIQEAAQEARKLGLSLAEVDKIADSLLNFESSISAELEAELLSGKQLNLEKARSAALTGDMATLSKELANNTEIMGAFQTGNRIQQDAIAKSLGMNREDMAKMIYQQQIQNGLTEEQAAQAADISLEEAKRLTSQEQITKSLEKLAAAFAPIIDAVASLASNSFVLYSTTALLAGIYISKLLPATIQSTIATTAQNAATTAGNVLKGAAISLSNSETLGKIRSTIATQANNAAQATSNFLQNTWIGGKLRSIGLWIAEKVQIVASTIAKWANVGATQAQVVADVELAAAQTTLATTGAAAGGGMAAAGAGLGAFGAAAAPAIPIILALGAALLMASPAIWAFSKVIEAVGTVVTAIFDGLAKVIPLIAEGFVNFLGAISLEKAAATIALGAGLYFLGTSLLTFAVGLAAASAAAFLGGGILEKIGEIAAASPAMVQAGNAVKDMAAGMNDLADALNKIDEDKLEAVEAFMIGGAVGGAVGGLLSGIGDAVSNAFGGGKEDPLVTEMREMKTLLAEIRDKNQDIYLDSNKVGTATAKAAVKTQ